MIIEDSIQGVKPTDHFSTDHIEFSCSSCGTRFRLNGINYCYNCGEKIDWSYYDEREFIGFEWRLKSDWRK